MKMLIIGYARHGKDTVAEMIQKHFGLSFNSSSMVACKDIVFPTLSKKYGYATEAECFNDRVNHRQEWFDMICEYNNADPTRLAKLVMKHADIYVGMRSKCELEACVQDKVFDLIVWVDASERHPPESSQSCTVSKDMADIIIYNNGTVEQLEKTITEKIKCTA